MSSLIGSELVRPRKENSRLVVNKGSNLVLAKCSVAGALRA